MNNILLLKVESNTLAITQPSQGDFHKPTQTFTESDIHFCDGCDGLVIAFVTAETLAVRGCAGCDGKNIDFQIEKTKSKKIIFLPLPK